MDQKIICFGEMLWDLLPTGKMAGGAPMNVAIHLKYNGFSPVMVSRVGKDALGSSLMDFLHEKGLSTDFVQIDPDKQTGVVEVNMSNKNEVTYSIVKPVAWDSIEFEERVAKHIFESDVFIYGSLAARSKATRETLFQYLPLAEVNVFDVNLRSPHYTPLQVEELLSHADIVKMNNNELAEIMSWSGKTGNEKESLEYLKSRFKPSLLIVTRGENGAAVLSDEGYFEHPGFVVQVEDTIGSGDSFLAAFLYKFLLGASIDEVLPYACATGAYVATQRGATPVITESIIQEFILKSSITFPHP